MTCERKWMCIVAGLCSVALWACVPNYEGKRSGPRVAILGDSISTSDWSADELRAKLVDSYRVSISAKGGRRIDEAQENAEDYAFRQFNEPPDHVVINLGTNDAYQGSVGAWDFAKSKPALDRMIRTFPNTKCIHLTTVISHTLNAEHNANARSLNAHMFKWAFADPRIRIIQWDDFVGKYYGAGSPFGPLTTDTIHPAQIGQDMLAHMTDESVRGCE